ncbi:MAG: hypothetical protein IPK85_04195 [Gemmatimonadetes bacterium]|nr:hypothetical protein [Gemmatimonadota bacterium]
MVCSNTGLTLGQTYTQTGFWPVIVWGGYCWVMNAVILPINMPPNAVSPIGPVPCARCDDPAWCPPGPRYVFLQPCPGQTGVISQPPLAYCLADVLAYRGAPWNIRCPATGVNNKCFWFDWGNARPNKPANYTLTTVAATGIFDGCCQCLPEPCTRAEVYPPNSIPCPGVTETTNGTACCANGLLGRASVTWQYDAYSTNDLFRDVWSGYSNRNGPNVAGEWRKRFYLNGTLITDETFMFSFVLGIGTPFNPDNIIPNEALPGGPLPACGQGCSGSWSSSCRSFVYNVECISQPRPGPRSVRTVNYQCAPNPGYCAEGCSDSTPSTLPPFGPAGGEPTLLPDLTALLDAFP